MIIYRDFSLKEIVYYKIGGKAEFVLKIKNKEDLLEALDFIKKNKIKRVMPIGLGSNLLLNDNFFDGAVLWFSNPLKNTIIQKDSNLVEVFASSILDDLIQFAFNKNLIGLEWAGGLPSTIGGAVRGNAGAFGGEIGSSVEQVELFEIGGSGEFVQKICKASELEFGYRDSKFKKNKNWIIGNVYFRLREADTSALEGAKQIYLSNIDYRNKHHPTKYPSCGSVFKNIREKERVETIVRVWPDIKDLVVNKWHNKVSTGYVINRLGFSGLRVGGAEVSIKHGNYILNVDNAKLNDVVSIIERIKQKFYKTFNFYPEVEVEIVT